MDDDEYTPLLSAAPRRRSRHSVVRRFCRIALLSTLIYLFLAAVVPTAFTVLRDALTHRYGHWGLPCKGEVSYDELRDILLETPSSNKAEDWSRYYTAGPHLAGKNYSQALWTKERWEEFGIKSEIVSYDVYLNYPVDHRLALLKKENSGDDSTSAWKVSFEASLTEDVIEEDPTSGLEDSVPTFHGYSASGNVTAPIVYVNYGTYQDFEDLLKANVSLEGKIAIARYGGIFRGLKVKRAQELGMIGTILFTDPGDDGDITDEKGVLTYPDGPARQPSSVQRGSTQFLSVAPGDPTTPGYPSKPGVPRQPVDGAIPSIPSLPISYLDAIPILKALNGHGPKASDFNQYWTRNTGLKYKGVEYNIGPTPDDIAVNLYSKQEYVTTPLWNVIGTINGTIPDEVIIVGNHRDAWIAGGASDPNSGSAVINEVIRGFGEALSRSWKPLRTIVFASWDGEEYGLIGSTEWVEEFLPWLSKTNVAYLNVDVGVKGPHFSASAAPLLHNVIKVATAAVQSPNQTIPGQTVFDEWNKRISTMGSGSDFTAFQDFAGIPSIDVGFGSETVDPVYHYHSNYDSFYWMQKFGDPGFKYHRAMAQVMGLIAAQLVDLPVISFSASDYAHALRDYLDKVKAKLEGVLSPLEKNNTAELSEEAVVELRASTRRDPVSRANHGPHDRNNNKNGTAPSLDAESFRDSLDSLYKRVRKLTSTARALDQQAQNLERQLGEHYPWYHWYRYLRLWWAIRKVNNSYKVFERSFLWDLGLDGRPWFKHVVFAPGLWTGYAGAVFPGLMESIDTEDWENAVRWAGIIETCMFKASQQTGV
ncbi:hypothetical protein B0T26DRAFT_27384 [Lasiosphaeria miniovina]|uniref:Glutamate carboxypeptidase n=1 Tax=Lasiosphaeria miniovina TaxID=1954250 RepID=A0AA40E9Q7_9PEZI|nr:uncharacterized protein B0T26DRAFT_27384 [Lasiosphaeria miniovina]KAK0733579.1 hypothetical protein B0T26DRAFT_27384 [Lasiosphaeria miniovina]